MPDPRPSEAAASSAARTASGSQLAALENSAANVDVRRSAQDRVVAPGPVEQGRSAQDEVDRLIAGWSRERPELDVTPLSVLSRVTRLARHLDRARRSAFAEHDLEQWEFDVLAALRRAGPPYELSPGRLVTQMIVTSGTMTNRIDRLAKRGLVSRRPDPSDRRGVLVGLTPDGRRRTDDALDSLLAREHELLAELAPDDGVELARLLRTLLLPFEAKRDEV